MPMQVARRKALSATVVLCVAFFLVPSSSAQAAPGREIWRQVIDGSSSQFDGGRDEQARSVVTDGNGDVVVAGVLANAETDHDFTVIKFDGTTGAELWRQEVDGSASGFDYDGAAAVTVDQDNDVIAAGYLQVEAELLQIDFAVIKFAGDTGTELWRSEIPRGGLDLSDRPFAARALVVDSNADVIAAGALVNDITGSDFTVIKFNGATGAELWRQVIDGSSLGFDVFDSVWAVALDDGGNVVACGDLENDATGRDFTIIKFNSTTGAELWRREIAGEGAAFDHCASVSVDHDNDVVAGGETGNDSLLLKFDGTSGEELWRQRLAAPEAPGSWISSLARAMAARDRRRSRQFQFSAPGIPIGDSGQRWRCHRGGLLQRNGR
jgi:outer membrane protein assembly factor BamB